MMDILLFGDQTGDCQVFLKKALRRKGYPLLSSFLEQAHVALQDEVESLPASTRRQLPPFSNVSEFVERYYDATKPSLATESAITCLAQLTHFIGFFEQYPSAYLEPNSTQILGVCTGLLAASAVASSSSLNGLIPLAVQAVRVAFRLGARVSTIASQLESTISWQQTWSTVVVGISGDIAYVAINEFNTEQALVTSNKLYLSAVSTTSVTVSGPPSARSRLFEQSQAFQGLQRKEISIRGPYHANHLYDSSDVDKIITKEICSCISQYSQVYPLVTSSEAENYTSAFNLFRKSVYEILVEQVHLDPLVKQCTAKARESSHQSVRVLAMGPTALGNGLVSALKISGGITLSLEDHMSWISQNHIPNPCPGKMADAKIAIVGMAGRFPGAADHEAFWQLLEQGLDVHREVPADRFDVKAHTDDSGKGRNKSHTPYGCFIEKPGLFDPRFFNMSPREATQTDPMQRLALSTAYEAMEMAGFVRDRTPSSMAHRVGTFYGQTSDDWREINAAQDIDTYFITGGVRAFGPGRINYHYGFSGPSFNIDTACSSSMAAIQLACTSLRAGDCDTVFTGGMNVMTNPDIFSGLSKGQFLSKTGSCKTYDDEADGYCRGDGVVTLIMKRLQDAETDRDPILGIIAGIATNHSAEAVSITHPHVGAQQYLFQKVMDEAGVDVRDVKYVEMHGTGTQAGDGVEMESVSSVFAPPNKIKRRENQPLFVGSVKANIGHGEAVSGACAFIKVLMMFQKNMIPPHCGIKDKMNHNFPEDLQDRNLNIAFQPTPFPRRKDQDSRYVFINNFSAAGGNSATLIQDAPRRSISLIVDPRSTHVVVVTAKSLWSFKQNAQRLLSWVQANSSASLPSLSYTTTARRYHYNYRVAIEAKSFQQLEKLLSSSAQAPRVPVSSKKPQVAFAFTGQGSHYLGMGKSLFNHSKQFRCEIEDCDRIAKAQGFPSFISLIDGTLTDLADATPIVTQLAIVSVEIALAQLWKSWGIFPSAVIGHSLGEYAALQVAGVLSIHDTLRLVGLRAQLLVANCTAGSHGMLAVTSSLESVEDLITNLAVETACINGPEQVVFSAPIDEINNLGQILISKGLKCTKLKVPYAFHSSQVDSILDVFTAAAAFATFHSPKIPVISPLLGEVIQSSGKLNATYLVKHCRQTVNFLGGLEAALRCSVVDDHTIWMEIGPHPVCSAMIKATIGEATRTVPSLTRNDDSWKISASSICALYNAGAEIDWSEYHKNFDEAHEVLSMPSYAYDEKVYWIDYKENWCLDKGLKRESTQAKVETPVFSTTAIQKIISETVTAHSALVIGESDLAHPLLRAAIEGHLVNGVGLCPSSIYADMALTICDYAYRAAKPDTPKIHMNVAQMETHKPLVLSLDSRNSNQILQVEARVDLTHSRASVTYRSVIGDSFVEQAQCLVSFEDASVWSNEWERRKFLIQGRIDSLRTQEGSHRIGRGMAYKLFSSLVQYDNKYRGMEEVTLNSEGLEATARVVFQSSLQDGKFFMSPYLIDSACHISGFIMNANDAVDSKKQVYISHGWETMRFAKRLVHDKKYRSYVKMQVVPGGGKMVAGDVYVFEGEEIIGVVGGLKFQCIPKALLDTLLSPSKNSRPASKPIAQTIPASIMIDKPAKTMVIEGNKTVPKAKALKVVTKEITSKSAADQVTARALSIIADEIGCEISELADSINFADMGVDSLMSLSISGRFREELEISFQSTAFVDMPTVGLLKSFLVQFETNQSSGLSTPDMISSNSSSEVDSEEVFEFVEPVNIIIPDETDNTNTSDPVLQQLIRTTIADEMGVDIDEISDNTDLSTMGMDSLMSLSILGALREKTGLNLQADLLVENTCVEMIETSLGLRKKRAGPKAKIDNRSSKAVSQDFSMMGPKMGPLSSYPAAQSILLQGNPKTATHTLFLLPDGSGSATSYATLPDIGSSVCVFGLNCPFMKTPEDFVIGVEGVTKIYMAEIQRRQPKGPYILGGWSAGGVLAYEMTRQMIQNGESVEKLVLIDSPCPIKLEALPAVFHRYCDSIGLLGTGDPAKTPKWLLPHFASAVRELTKYSVSLDSINVSQHKGMPKTIAIWARDGIVRSDGPQPVWDPEVPMPNSMYWLSNDRHDLGPNGWENLVGAKNISCASTIGNHFTMMRDPITKDVSAAIRRALQA
ncbi:Conidial yellow pigment biosynthesis polyketide synthase 2 [Phlyctema vagabunda]|uniref:Conidial yellow pigment biosynthesis polyketide synthase 2 n=1 Tax=Phlyctema vagabunda TaxID=108571 RepID=A0ABR4P5N5_9HELO